MSKMIFNKICIIESLTKEDTKTGERVANHLEMLNIFKQKKIIVEHYTLSTKQELLHRLDSLTYQAQIEGLIPILQIDAHGAKEGIQLNSGESLVWEELESHLEKLNLAIRGNLLIVMSACFGIFSSRLMRVMRRSICWAVVGPLAEIYPAQLESSLSTMYEALFGGDQIVSALNSLSAEGGKLEILTAEYLFVKAYKYALENHQHNPTLALANLSDPTTFINILRHFMMVDLFPENIEKISVTKDRLSFLKF